MVREVYCSALESPETGVGFSRKGLQESKEKTPSGRSSESSPSRGL